MSRRPQIINPITNQIMNVFSKDFENLLDQDYNIHQLLNIPYLKTSPNIPLTGFPDIDRNLIIYLPLSDLTNLYYVNRYARSLCHTKEFWLDKIKNEDLTLPKINIQNVNWVLLYSALENAMSIIKININSDDFTRFEMIESFQISDLLKLLKLSNINYDLKHNGKIIPIIEIALEFDKTITILVQTIEIPTTKVQLLVFLIYMYYYNLISKVN